MDGIGRFHRRIGTPTIISTPTPNGADFTYARAAASSSRSRFNPGEWGIAPNDLEATDTSQSLAMLVLRPRWPVPAMPAALTFAISGASRHSRGHGHAGDGGAAGRLGSAIRSGGADGMPASRQVADAVVQRIGDGYVGWQENYFPGLLGNVVAGRIANRLDLGGTNCVVDAACASSLCAIHLAGHGIADRAGRCVVTGGVDTFNDIFMYMCFSKTPALSPTGDAKPFDAAGDGTILGEGLGMVVLKRLADAERDGDRVYAVIKGSARRATAKATRCMPQSRRPSRGVAGGVSAGRRDAGHDRTGRSSRHRHPRRRRRRSASAHDSVSRRFGKSARVVSLWVP